MRLTKYTDSDVLYRLDAKVLRRIVADWIRHAVDVRPGTMRKVARKPLGNLAHFVHSLANGEMCGCLIGSTALMLAPGRTLTSWSAVQMVTDKINHLYDYDATSKVGYAVWALVRLANVPRPLDADAGDEDNVYRELRTNEALQESTKAWIKDTILLALKRRRQRLYDKVPK